MDAAWGRGKFRTEVWDDDANPSNFWWENFAPSKEEIEASQQGYDFADPKGWCEAKGLNYEEVKEKTKKALEERIKMLSKTDDAITSNDVVDASFSDFFKLQSQFLETTFRYEDNLKQIEKGQPSLDVEDTGVQFKNDPVKKK
eukprot:CAMPEP_0182429178 /NCGR_PEP_ID=MMETSP1167-20130531/25573_1 /TAXON_ID=2988 /ORGANISM="Mallomonas Sp, Strain CCMP3275" /LENGTH=142 /DNA_ID=CAMNT_0024612547 /DNA_START=238 /DNA_END=666 /DNA_ORIENTATION=+